jgi:hypothetical protein
MMARKGLRRSDPSAIGKSLYFHLPKIILVVLVLLHASQRFNFFGKLRQTLLPTVPHKISWCRYARVAIVNAKWLGFYLFFLWYPPSSDPGADFLLGEEENIRRSLE